MTFSPVGTLIFSMFSEIKIKLVDYLLENNTELTFQVSKQITVIV